MLVSRPQAKALYQSRLARAGCCKGNHTIEKRRIKITSQATTQILVRVSAGYLAIGLEDSSKRHCNESRPGHEQWLYYRNRTLRSDIVEIDYTSMSRTARGRCVPARDLAQESSRSERNTRLMKVKITRRTNETESAQEPCEKKILFETERTAFTPTLSSSRMSGTSPARQGQNRKQRQTNSADPPNSNRLCCFHHDFRSATIADLAGQRGESGMKKWYPERFARAHSAHWGGATCYCTRSQQAYPRSVGP
ncbi:hypothetical protein BDV95DRAFT_283960 [Massariosphaeria phaeospora]|uniref:Uncharacterized protein n=1 Tax=Massariosphaeria phaeospora TaxID=100035 RepID=A0A7C8MSG8_9PLEO|nr:hypothetical protein BDV95DRAFT_283960 [Massariosphaeria phaeospora]